MNEIESTIPVPLKEGPGFKVCPKCERKKPRTEFFKNRSRKDGLAGECKPCHKVHCNSWGIRNSDLKKKYSRKSNLKRWYGLTPDQVDDMKLAQKGKCAICQNEEPLMVDHNHSTGRIRELLCNRCNAGLGQFFENSALLDAAKAYLAKHTG